MLNVEYTYIENTDGGTSSRSKFIIDSNIVIAGPSLKVNFIYEKGQDFIFTVTISPDNPSATIRSVLASILGSTDIELPSFVYNTKLNSGSEGFFSLKVCKKETSFLLVSQLNVANVPIDFAQMHSTEWSARTSSKRLF